MPVRRAARGSRLEGGSDPPVHLVACGVTGLSQYVHCGTDGSLHRFAKAACGPGEIVPALHPCSDVALSIAGISACRKECGDQRRPLDCELVDRPDTDARLAKLADGIRSIRVSSSKFAHQSHPPRHKVAERSLVQARGVHGQSVRLDRVSGQERRNAEGTGVALRGERAERTE